MVVMISPSGLPDFGPARSRPPPNRPGSPAAPGRVRRAGPRPARHVGAESSGRSALPTVTVPPGVIARSLARASGVESGRALHPYYRPLLPYYLCGRLFFPVGISILAGLDLRAKWTGICRVACLLRGFTGHARSTMQALASRPPSARTWIVGQAGQLDKSSSLSQSTVSRSWVPYGAKPERRGGR